VVTSDGGAPALVLFEDGSPEMERVAAIIAERLAAGGRSVTLRAASAVTVPDILKAGLFVLGAESVDPPSFGELARVLDGINLAGRKAAFFGASGAATARLRGMCGDTDVIAARADLVGRRLEAVAVAAWLRGVI